MKFIGRTYQIGVKWRVSRLIVGLLSLAVLLIVQFYVVGGVTGDTTITQWSSAPEVFVSQSGPHLNYKVLMVVLLILGLALVTLGVESIIDRWSAREHFRGSTRNQNQMKGDRYTTFQRNERRARERHGSHVKQLSIQNS